MLGFNPPPLGLEPQQLRSTARPSGSRTSTMRASSTGRPGSASRAGPLVASSFSGSKNNNASNNQKDSGSLVATQERLVQNLKQQVDVLTKELHTAKTHPHQQNVNLPAEGSPATHAVIPLRPSQSPIPSDRGISVENVNNNSSNNMDGFIAITNTNKNRPDLLQQQQQTSGLITFSGTGEKVPVTYSHSTNVGRNINNSSGNNSAGGGGGGLQNEVALLRQRHGEMERNYSNTVANLRRALEEAHTMLLESDVIDPRSLSGPKLVKRNPADARQRIAADQKERAHAVEIVELQKAIDRLKSQVDIKEGELVSIRKEKDAMVQELVTAKDAGRSALNEAAIAKKQLEEIQSQYRLEQEQRHQLEDKLNSLQRSNAATEGAVNEEYEAKNRQLTAQLSVAKCEAESAKMGEDKWRNEIQAMSVQNAELARTAELAREHASHVEVQWKDTQAKLEDTESQREFFQLTVDRMRVEETSMNARHQQVDNILRAERENMRELERRYNRALEEQESLSRTLRQREVDQQRHDGEDTKMRAQAKYAIDNADNLKKENEQLRHQLAGTTRKLETTTEMQQTERQIQNAIAKMEQAKYEMSGILQRQIRVAQDVAQCVSALPKEKAHQSPASRDAASLLEVHNESNNYNTAASASPNSNLNSNLSYPSPNK